jgi:hypothetical protein
LQDLMLPLDPHPACATQVPITPGTYLRILS